MKYTVPDYCLGFQCLASRCRHSCCIGWEIDIDEESCRRYRRMGGALGEKLRERIAPEPQPHFILGEGERCPFLNRDNLCELILEAGEESLCDICAEHPRFYRFLPGRTEMGLGLCCEEAARRLLTGGPIRLLTEGDGEEDGEEEDAAFLTMRRELFSLLQKPGLPLRERVRTLLDRCETVLPERSLSSWARFYQGLERLDESWTGVLRDIEARGDQIDWQAYGQAARAWEQGYENLLFYFLYRYLEEDGAPGEALGFALLSASMIAAADAVQWQAQGGSLRLEERVEHVRLYSSEIEYSDENVGEIGKALSRNP